MAKKKEAKATKAPKASKPGKASLKTPPTGGPAGALLTGRLAVNSLASLPKSIMPLGALTDRDLCQDQSQLVSKGPTSKKILKKVAKTIAAGWADIYTEGISRTRGLVTAGPDESPPGVSERDESLEDGGASVEASMSARLIRNWVHPNLAQQLKDLIREGDGAKKLVDVDLRTLFPNNAMGAYVHPAVGFTHAQGAAGAGLVALHPIPAGTICLIEDALFPLATQADEEALVEQAGTELETIDADEGPVDLACMSRAVARSCFRMINALDSEPVKEWLAKVTDMPPCVDDIPPFPTNLLADAPALSAKLAALCTLYPRCPEETQGLKDRGHFKPIQHQQLNNWMMFHLEVISLLLKNIFAGSDELVDFSPESIYFRFKLNGLHVAPFEEQITAQAFNPASGMGTFALTSLLNHSCEPNTSRSTLCNTMIITTTRDVPAGSPILLSYLPLEELAQNAEERRANLSKFRDFECSCTRCALKKGEGTGADMPVEDKLLIAYQSRDYPAALEAAIDLWNSWAALVNQVHSTADSEAISFIPFPPVKGAKELTPVHAIEEPLLFACGHIFRAALLLKIQNASASPAASLKKYMKKDENLKLIAEHTAKNAAYLASMLYGGGDNSFFLRWLFELSGDFYAPLEEAEGAQVKRFISAYCAGE